MSIAQDYSEAEPKRAEVDAWREPAVIEFGNNWCGYCRRAQPLIAEAFALHQGLRHLKIADADLPPRRQRGRARRAPRQRGRNRRRAREDRVGALAPNSPQARRLMRIRAGLNGRRFAAKALFFRPLPAASEPPFDGTANPPHPCKRLGRRPPVPGL